MKLKNNKSVIIFFFIWFLFFLLLSFLRDSRLDENIYISDSVTISNLLKSGEWIGNYGVGLHGFINKFVMGVIFLFTGPSIFLATLMNIIFAVLSGVLFYKILFLHLKFSKLYSLLGVTFLFSSYQFLTYVPTFYRDIIALFFLLLVIDTILSKKSKWLTGLFLLLLLDSKEHVFFTVAPMVLIWTLIEGYLNRSNGIMSFVKNSFIGCLKLFSPTLIFLILMFTTSAVPLNIYNANILGLIDGGMEQMTSNFELSMATDNRDVALHEDIAREMPTFDTTLLESKSLRFLVEIINVILAYTGKILYPRTFSFLSIPLLVLIPSIAFSLKYFMISLRKKEATKLLLPLLLFGFIFLYIAHASIGRYIIPITPVIILFFIMFLNNVSSKKYSMKVLLVTLLFVIGGLLFEYSFVSMKIGINALLFSILVFICFGKKRYVEILKYLFIIIVSIFFIGTSVYASYKHGQIRGYHLWGYDRECEKVISLVDKEEVILINDINWDKLPFLLREESLGDSEWTWTLKEWVPKKKLLKEIPESKTYNMYWEDIDTLKEYVSEYKITKIVYVNLTSDIVDTEVLLQDRLEVLLNTDWLALDSKHTMKNKNIYIFSVR